MKIELRKIGLGGELALLPANEDGSVIGVLVTIGATQFELSEREGQLRLSVVEGVLHLQPLATNAVVASSTH